MAFLAGFDYFVVLVALVSKPKLLKKHFNVLILNLAIVDMAVAIFDLPLQVN